MIRKGSTRPEKIAVHPYAYNPADPCFYCHDPLSGEVVLYWGGSVGDIYFHPGCFLEMATRMFRDLHNVELAYDYRVLKNAAPRSPTPSPDPRLVRQ
jgi:hypothetical protein